MNNTNDAASNEVVRGLIERMTQLHAILKNDGMDFEAAAVKQAADALEAMEKENERLKTANRTLNDSYYAMRDDLFKAQAELAEERRIVDRIWAILGSPSYEDLNGKSIYDLITDLKSKFEAAREGWITAIKYHMATMSYKEAEADVDAEIEAKLKEKGDV